MEASAVVKHFNKLKDSLTSFGSGFEVAAVDQLVLEGAPEGFHGGIIVAVTFAAHGSDGLGVLEGAAIVLTGVLNAPVGMKHQACGRLALTPGHAPGGQDQFGVDVFAHGPARQAPAVKVQNAGQIEPAFLGVDVSDVAEPDLVGGARSGQFGQAVRSNGLVMVAVGGADPEPAFGAATEALLAH